MSILDILIGNRATQQQAGPGGVLNSILQEEYAKQAGVEIPQQKSGNGMARDPMLSQALLNLGSVLSQASRSGASIPEALSLGLQSVRQTQDAVRRAEAEATQNNLAALKDLAELRTKQRERDQIAQLLSGNLSPDAIRALAVSNPALANAAIGIRNMETQEGQRQAVQSMFGIGQPQQSQQAPGAAQQTATGIMGDVQKLASSGFSAPPAVQSQSDLMTPAQMQASIQQATFSGQPVSSVTQPLLQPQDQTSNTGQLQDQTSNTGQLQAKQPAQQPIQQQQSIAPLDAWVMNTAEGQVALRGALASGNFEKLNSVYNDYVKREQETTRLGRDAAKTEQEKRLAAYGVDATEGVFSNITNQVDRLLNNPEGLKSITGPRFGVNRALFPEMWDTKAASAQAALDTVRENLSTERLQQIRAAGFAPGTITEKEWPRFENALVSLKNAQTTEEMQESLLNLKSVTNDINNKRRAAYGISPAEAQGGAPADNADAAGGVQLQGGGFPPMAAPPRAQPVVGEVPLQNLDRMKRGQPEKQGVMEYMSGAAQDLLAGTGTAAVKGAAGVAGIPGLLYRGVNAVLPEDYKIRESNLPPMPEDIARSMLEGTGTPEYKAKTGLGEAAMRAGEFAAGAGLFPAIGALSPLGGTASQMLKTGALAGVGSSAGEQAFRGTDLEVPASILGALAAPMALPAAGKAVAGRVSRAMGSNASVSSEADNTILDVIKAYDLSPEQAKYLFENTGNTSMAERLPGLLEIAKDQATKSPVAARTAVRAGDRMLEDSLKRIDDAVSRQVSAGPEINGKPATSLSEVDELYRTVANKEAEPFSQAFALDAAKGFTESGPRAVIKRLQETNKGAWKHIVELAKERGVEIGNDPRKWTLGTLDEIKQGIDDIFRSSKTGEITSKYVNQDGSMTRNGRYITDIRKDLNEFLRLKSPSYASRNDILSASRRAREALDEGFSFMADKPREMAKRYGLEAEGGKAAKEAEKKAYLVGVSMALRDTLPTLARGGVVNYRRIQQLSPYIGEGAAQQLSNFLKSEETIQKAARELTSVKPKMGYRDSGRDLAAGVADATRAVRSPVYAASSAILRWGDKILTGRNDAYYKKLSEELTTAITTNDRKAISDQMKRLVDMNQKELSRLKSLRGSAVVSGAASAGGKGDER